jgi:hypothetical protein
MTKNAKTKKLGYRHIGDPSIAHDGKIDTNRRAETVPRVFISSARALN